MNQETTYESGVFETDPQSGESQGEYLETGEPSYGETMEAPGGPPSPGGNGPGKVPHPQFGLVRPLGREGEGSEEWQGEGGEGEEEGGGPGQAAVAPSGGKVMHPQFGMVKPLGRGQGEFAEEWQEAGEVEGEEGEEEVQFEALEEEIIGGDERFHVKQTTLNPWRWVCWLELRYKDFLATGTGLLISPKHVLTCSHNLFDRTTKSPVQAVSVIPGCNGAANMPFGRHAAASWSVTNEFRTAGDPRFDFGLVTLREPIGNARQRRLAGRPLGYWSKPLTRTTILHCNPGDPRLRGKRATLSGYPGDKPDGQQWAAKGEIVNVTPAAGRQLIYYTADSCAGHSGSPVWIRAGVKAGLVGIHTGPCIVRAGSTDCRIIGPSKCFPRSTRREATSNRAVLITPQLWARVKGWMR